MLAAVEQSSSQACQSAGSNTAAHARLGRTRARPSTARQQTQASATLLEDDGLRRPGSSLLRGNDPILGKVCHLSGASTTDPCPNVRAWKHEEHMLDIPAGIDTHRQGELQTGRGEGGREAQEGDKKREAEGGVRGGER
jgi:hypothetical protein